MGRTKRGSKELSREKELRLENQQLKKKISSLRKQLARIDLDHYVHVRNMLEEHYHSEETNDSKGLLDSLKKEWTCKVCTEGYLEIILYNKINETYYHRKCNNCPNRTKSQKYSEQVKGIVKKEAA